VVCHLTKLGIEPVEPAGRAGALTVGYSGTAHRRGQNAGSQLNSTLLGAHADAGQRLRRRIPASPLNWRTACQSKETVCTLASLVTSVGHGRSSEQEERRPNRGTHNI
jgi:hypothetical protein